MHAYGGQGALKIWVRLGVDRIRGVIDLGVTALIRAFPEQAVLVYMHLPPACTSEISP